jgi:hypothetical protein
VPNQPNISGLMTPSETRVTLPVIILIVLMVRK